METIAHAIGAGLGSATIWLPITYFSARSQLGLRNDIGRAWQPYIICVAVFSVISLFGFDPPIETTVGLASFLLLPIAVCSLVLYCTFRAQAENSAPNAASRRWPHLLLSKLCRTSTLLSTQVEGKATHVGLPISGCPDSTIKINRGLLRLWLLVNFVWAGFSIYQIYSCNRGWESGFSAAKSQAGALESMQKLWIQNYVFDAKAAHERMQTSGVFIGPFDEARVREEAYSQSFQLIEKSEEKRQVDQTYRDAFDSRDMRDSFIPWALTVPIGTALIFVAIPWVIRGFKK